PPSARDGNLFADLVTLRSEQAPCTGEAGRVKLVVEHAQLHRSPGLRRVDESAFTRVDRDVRDAPAVDAEEQEIAGCEPRYVHWLGGCILLGGRARGFDSDLPVDVAHESAAIEALRSDPAPFVRSAEQRDGA